MADLKRSIREVPNYPKPGILFYDVTTLFRNPEAFHSAIERMLERFRDEKLDGIVGIEARGFVLAAPMAYALNVGLLLARKPGKLPHATDREDYALEYGTASVEMHLDAVAPGQRLLVVDDVLATGGTAAATGKLVERLGGKVEGYAFLVELGFLGGRKCLPTDNVFGLIQYG